LRCGPSQEPSTVSNCINFSTQQIEKLMQFGIEVRGADRHRSTLMDLGARVVPKNR
jgi:hypothetical protein